MTTLVEKIAAGLTRVTQLLKQTANDLNGKIGNLSNLNTTQKASLVTALNEVLALTGEKAKIDDTVKNTANTWSSNKIDAVINSAISALINGADVDNDTLKELADRITAVAQAEAGLVSATSAQTFTAPQQLQARSNIGAVATIDVGDIGSADFVSVVNTAYTS